MNNYNSPNSDNHNTSSYPNDSNPYNTSADGYTLPPKSAEINETHLKHSGPGIASFVVGLVGFLGHLVTFALMSLVLNNTIELLGSSISREELAIHPAFVLGSFAFLVCLILNFIGLILGIIGLALKNRRKVFAIIGTILSGLLILFFTVLVLGGIYLT
ncbi:hypothetical protein ABIE27_004020 [Paenibacillus sp. 4624]|jgi:hypothetical protein|uniref:DUF4064 domain-containing protein n=1 Tax=Paenibacillus amylolyticus TaxID=1451 RepID=A0A5M9WU77_PAEAM|nr:hypothetical protein [Paenibacillus amylolyticus]KAA8785196.1 hypothetical protein EC604_15230 [Paenibacillus amylolyticus]